MTDVNETDQNTHISYALQPEIGSKSIEYTYRAELHGGGAFSFKSLKDFAYFQNHLRHEHWILLGDTLLRPTEVRSISMTNQRIIYGDVAAS